VTTSLMAATLMTVATSSCGYDAGRQRPRTASTRHYR
jgi:hypothetical protein